MGLLFGISLPLIYLVTPKPVQPEDSANWLILFGVFTFFYGLLAAVLYFTEYPDREEDKLIHWGKFGTGFLILSSFLFLLYRIILYADKIYNQTHTHSNDITEVLPMILTSLFILVISALFFLIGISGFIIFGFRCIKRNKMVSFHPSG